MDPLWALPAIAVPCAAAGLHCLVDRAGAHRRALHVAVFAAALTLVPGSIDHRNSTLTLLPAAALAALALVVGWALRRRPIPMRWARRVRALVLRCPRAAFVLGIVLVTTVLCASLSWALFHGIPVIQDSQAQLFHARIFASGRLVAPEPPLPEFWEADHVITHGAFYSQYPPGHSILLMLGVLAGAPFLVNPLLGGIALALVYACGRAIWNERTGRRAALLGLASPFVVFMSSEHMNHATALVLFALQILATVRAIQRGSIAWAALAGIAVGWQCLVRPLTAVGLAAPLGVLVLAHAIRAPRRMALPALAMAACAAAVASTLLVFNQATNGDPLLMGYVVRWGPEHTIGFGISPWGDPHTPADGVEHTLSNLDAWNRHLLGGALPAGLLVALGVARDRGRALVWALASAPVCVLAIYFFYFFQDLTFGPRYLYEASAFALLAAARGIGWIPELLRELRLASRRTIARGLAGWIVVLGVVVGMAAFLPEHIWEYGTGYRLHGGVVDGAEQAIPGGQAIVFCDGAYQRAFYAVDPDLRSRILFARDLGDARDHDLLCAMPGRVGWLSRDGLLRPLPPRREACREAVGDDLGGTR